MLLVGDSELHFCLRSGITDISTSYSCKIYKGIRGVIMRGYQSRRRCGGAEYLLVGKPDVDVYFSMD
jgi:hypothetical protein